MMASGTVPWQDSLELVGGANVVYGAAEVVAEGFSPT